MTHPEAVEAVAKVLYEVDAMTTDQWTAVHPDVQDAYRRDATAAVDVLIAAGWAPRAEVAEQIALAIEAKKPPVHRFWDTADAARVYALTDAAKIAREIGAKP